MPTEDFDLQNAIVLVQPYDGSPSQLEQFVDEGSFDPKLHPTAKALHGDALLRNSFKI